VWPAPPAWFGIRMGTADQPPWLRRDPDATAVIPRIDPDVTRVDLPPVRQRRPGALLPVAALALLAVVVAGGFALASRTGHGSQPAARTAGPASTAPSILDGSGAAPPASAAPPPAAPAVAGTTAPDTGQGGTTTYEAESAANTLTGSAVVAPYPDASGGKIVKNIGTWGNPARPGGLTFAVSAPAAGAYLLTFFYVHVNGDATRIVVVTVAGSAPTALAVTGGAACCSQRTLTVRLAAGTGTITFTNPKGHAPAIDRIELTPRTT
jgi:hypothetical protein